MDNEHKPPEITEAGRLKAPKITFSRKAVMIVSVLSLFIAYVVFRVASAPSSMEKAAKATNAGSKKTDPIDGEVPANVRRQYEAAQAQQQIAQAAAEQLQQEGPPLSGLANSLGFKGATPGRYNGANVGYGPGSPYGQYGYGQYQAGMNQQHSAVSAKEQRQEQAKREAEEKAEAAFKSSKMSHVVYRLKEEKGPPARLSGGTESVPVHTARVSAIARKQEEIRQPTAAGPLYKLYQGHIIDTALKNGINAHYTGPLTTWVTTDVYTHEEQALVIKAGSLFIGEAEAITESGESRVRIGFKRLIRTDKHSVELDMPGLDQDGASGLKADKVDKHYPETLLMVGAVGALAGFSMMNTSGWGGYGYEGSDAYRQGLSQSLSRSGMQLLQKILNRPWDVYINPGHRVEIYLMRDLELPAYADKEVN